MASAQNNIGFDPKTYVAITHKHNQPPRLDWIVANELSVDWRYQRQISPSHVQKIADNFNPDLLRALQVSVRNNGIKVVLDGQHRLEAIHKLGWSDQRVPCMVYEGLTVEQEAAIFAGSNNTKNLHPIDKFRSRVVAKEPQALMIKQAVEDAGFVLVLDSHNMNQYGTGLICVSCLEMICEQNGPAFLVLVLSIVRVAWDYEPTSRTRDIIEGVWRFLRWYAEEPNFNRDLFVQKLKTVSPVKLLRDAAALREALGGGQQTGRAGKNSVALSQLLVRLYNTGIRLNKHIPEWHDKEREARLPQRQAAGKLGNEALRLNMSQAKKSPAKSPAKTTK